MAGNFESGGRKAEKTKEVMKIQSGDGGPSPLASRNREVSRRRVRDNPPYLSLRFGLKTKTNERTGTLSGSDPDSGWKVQGLRRWLRGLTPRFKRLNRRRRGRSR